MRPDETVPMESKILQPVSGAHRMELYPYIRTVDMLSSNSYIISSEEQLALIDPGGVDDQGERLVEVLAELYEAKPRPLVVYLTHVHVDHSLQLCRRDLFGGFDQVGLAVQEEGALALEGGSPDMTLSRLLGKRIDPISSDIRLLSSRDLRDPCRRRLRLDCRMTIEYETEKGEISPGLALASQRIPVGGKDHIEVFHTPGHSPDSVCIRTGDLLFLGDLLLASNPGVAGIPGWSRTELMNSIRKVLWVLDERKIRVCCPGHGRPMDAATVGRTLERLYRYTESLDDLALIDQDWAKETAGYSHEALREMERLLTIIAGRLVLLSSVLQDLGEEEAAADIERLLDGAALDDLLACAHRHLLSHESAGILDIELVHRAGHIVGKLDRVFEKEMVRGLLEDHLLRRMERLLNDYMVTFRGFRPHQMVNYGDINAIVEESVDQFRKKPFDEDAIMEAETEVEYMEALMARISHVNLSDRVEIVLDMEEGLPRPLIDGERFCDLVIDLIERLAASRAEGIVLSTEGCGSSIVFRILGSGPKIKNPFREAEMKFLERSISLCGGVAVGGPGGEGEPEIAVRFFV